MHALDSAWDQVRQEFDTACSQAVRAARSQTTNEVNQIVRRLRQYRSENEWVAAVLDGASRFIEQAAVFSLQDDMLRLRAQHNLPIAENLSFPAASARAFANAISSMDPIVALRTSGEVGASLSTADPAERAHVLPIANGTRVVAVLFAASQEYSDLNALELIAGIASLVLERQANASLNVQIAPAAPKLDLAAAVAKEPNRSLPAWSELKDEQRSLHIRAQRFSRVKVAEMQLAHPDACRGGREQNDLYLFLKKEIDTARESYRSQFITEESIGMVDYLHLELVRTAAEGDESKLGADYPGQLG